MTAKKINADLFIVARQNLDTNDTLFTTVKADITINPGRLIGQRVVDLITTPLLADFLRVAREQTEDWANVLVSRVVGVLTDRPPESWVITLSKKETPAIHELLKKGAEVTLCHLLTDPRDITVSLPCVALYVKDIDHSEALLPEEDRHLQIGDQLLICGQSRAETHMRWTAHNLHALTYICTGSDSPCGSLWRSLYTGEQASPNTPGMARDMQD